MLERTPMYADPQLMSDDHSGDSTPLEECDGRLPTVLTSRIAGTKVEDPVTGDVEWAHAVTLDIDHACAVVPSSTPGHYHLMIDVALPWDAYRELLAALQAAGIISYNYTGHSIDREATVVRLPWVNKRAAAPPAAVEGVEEPF